MLCGILIKTDYKQLNRFVMKTKLLIIAGLIGVCCLISCKKEGMDNHGNSNVDGDKTEDTLPELEEVDDVCTKMDDINFMKYCYDNFDVNKDGKVSMYEANAVKGIVDYHNILSKVVSFAGIEYFSNLESFSLGCEYDSKIDVKTLDLRYNKNLQHCSIRYASKLSSLDLRCNIKLKYISIQWCSGLQSIYLPKSIESIPVAAFDGCNNLAIVDMSQCVNLKEFDGHNGYGNYTFSSEVLKEFSIGAVVPPVVNGNVFKSWNNPILRVPTTSIEEYKNSQWKHYFTEIISIEE